MARLKKLRMTVEYVPRCRAIRIIVFLGESSDLSPDILTYGSNDNSMRPTPVKKWKVYS